MKFGVREICDVVFKTTTAGQKVGKTTFASAGMPVLYIDTAKTSALEGAATTVYAQGGKGNTRLLAWEGEKTLTFTVEDAMLSPLGMAVLTGAGLYDAGDGAGSNKQHFAFTVSPTAASGATGMTMTQAEMGGVTTLTVDTTAGYSYATEVDPQGAVIKFLGAATMPATLTAGTATGVTWASNMTASGVNKVIVDFYATKTGTGFQQIEIDAESFGGYYYVEGSTLFRDQSSGADLPAEIIVPKAKIQSNFTFNLASTGDPSTFSFVMDAFPNPIKGGTRQVLAAIQISS